MRNGLILGIVATLLVGCSVRPKPEPQAVPAATVEMDGKWIVALGTTKLGAKHLAPPDGEDRAYAEQLPKGVARRCVAFLYRGGSIKPVPCAARRVDLYILVALEYKGGPLPSDRCVVYSTKDKRVVGEFVWYAQY